jgi:hypothetical protein
MSSSTRKTRNYRAFVVAKNNRPTCPGKHQALFESMRKNGFNPDFPILCYKSNGGMLVIVDGQHRHHFAEELGLPVYYRIIESRDSRKFNHTSVSWNISDYIASHVAEGNKEVTQLGDFMKRFGLPAVVSSSLLGGFLGTGNGLGKAIKSGEVEVTHRAFAERVAGIVQSISEVFRFAKDAKFIATIARFCLVPKFIEKTLIHKIKSCPGKLTRQASIEQYSLLLEEIYNYGSRSGRLALKFMADEIARKKNPVKKSSIQEKPPTVQAQSTKTVCQANRAQSIGAHA